MPTQLAKPHVAARVASFEDFDRRARAGQSLNVVFFGGSLTWGANSSDPNRTSYRGLMAQYLRERYPQAPIDFHDAALGGTGSKLGVFRLQRDVLSANPDIVFLDFTANDNLFGSDPTPLASYESLLRRIIGRGIPVMQVFLAFKFNFGPKWDPLYPARYRDHQKFVAAYGTGVGDVYDDIESAIASGSQTLDGLWPFDGAHPDDSGYRMFFDSVRKGFEQAIAQKRVCMLPEKHVFSSEFQNHQRIVLVDRSLPRGWRRAKTYRTSLWFDGLSSRWMGDVALADIADKETIEPLRCEFEGTFVGVFGEANHDGLSFRTFIDGSHVPYRQSPTDPPADACPFTTGPTNRGNLFMWRVLAENLAPGRHTLEIMPVFPDGATVGQLRIESACVAGGSTTSAH